MNQTNPLRFSNAEHLSIIHKQGKNSGNPELLDALRKSTERLYYAGKITSDAIWDLDLETNEIYRSEAFTVLSGYADNIIEPNLDWWFQKIHPEDKSRVQNKVKESIAQGVTYWQDEYRFLCADGNYKYLLDRWIILYKGEKAVRIIGAIQDLTERKELEARLVREEIIKQKMLSQASIRAQESERNEISRELHDNVNQILISAKLFMDSAKKDPSQAAEIIDKAIEYQMLALEEIRKLSKSLNTSLVKAVGLQNSIEDVLNNMIQTKGIEVDFQFNPRVEEKLNDEQQLMLFRVIQEQTSNIIKYADAANVTLLLNETGGNVHLVIRDDGKGFDTKQKSRGIGFVNIFSRVDAYHGKANIISSPGNGCTLEIRIPVK
jgi:PAS domain S-box-containing protein